MYTDRAKFNERLREMMSEEGVPKITVTPRPELQPKDTSSVGHAEPCQTHPQSN